MNIIDFGPKINSSSGDSYTLRLGPNTGDHYIRSRYKIIFDELTKLLANNTICFNSKDMLKINIHGFISIELPKALFKQIKNEQNHTIMINLTYHETLRISSTFNYNINIYLRTECTYTYTEIHEKLLNKQIHLSNLLIPVEIGKAGNLTLYKLPIVKVDLDNPKRTNWNCDYCYEKKKSLIEWQDFYKECQARNACNWLNPKHEKTQTGSTEDKLAHYNKIQKDDLEKQELYKKEEEDLTKKQLYDMKETECCQQEYCSCNYYFIKIDNLVLTDSSDTLVCPKFNVEQAPPVVEQAPPVVERLYTLLLSTVRYLFM